jgi:hypothetical protein
VNLSVGRTDGGNSDIEISVQTPVVTIDGIYNKGLAYAANTVEFIIGNTDALRVMMLPWSLPAPDRTDSPETSP